jgi:transposase InsO family protein
MSHGEGAPPRARWARFRFSVVGPLLAAPPEPGELRARLEELAGRSWRHPTTGEVVRFGMSTIERWFYMARNEPKDPVRVLERRVRKNAGTQPKVSAALGQAIKDSYRLHPTWSYQLHYDNIITLIERDDSLGEKVSYGTLCRFMKARALIKQKKRRRGRRGDELPPTPREVRSFEVEHVHGLWHLDFHECSRSVSTKGGERKKPWAAGILDDRSRLACHLQWYMVEDAENLVHSLSQGIQKRGLPRSLLTDNGGAMMAAETVQGLERLGIIHWTTLPATPEQNGKQECFWGQLEGRLIAMLEGERELSLALLNEATQAWVELEYNRSKHSAIGQTPLERFAEGPSLARESPSSEELRRAFRQEVKRTLRRSDTTISVEGRRFELPSRYRTLLRPTVRYARWDLSQVDLIDPMTGRYLCALFPTDKERNASGRRSVLDPVMTTRVVELSKDAGVAPLLSKLMADYAATGLVPAYLPTDTDEENDDE